MENAHSRKSIITEFFTEKGNLDDKRYNLETDTDSKNPSIERIVKIQGARIIDEANVFLHYYDHLLDRKIEVYQSRLIMPDNDLKLSQIFDVTPYGLIKKNRTGIGATTLELRSERNSIIVVPTQSLALSKVESSYNEKIKQYQYLYVGGRKLGKKFPPISSYLKNTNIPIKKFIVVADSLPKLIEGIGDSVYKDYFFMVDEIDTYQSDSFYRPALESVLDFYFRFDAQKRCMVSATVDFFSSPKMNEEPVLTLDYQTPIPREIDVVYTNIVAKKTTEKIVELIKENPDDKILIAYNSVSKGIKRIIEYLNPELRKECKVLCSEKSKSYVSDYYHEPPITDELPAQITFMSCTYFIGIDIKERFHLISVADASLIFSLLSTNKFYQISGRCRHKDGVKSETIIYSSLNIFANEQKWYELRDEVVKDAEFLTAYAELSKYLAEHFPELISYIWLNSKEIIERSGKSYAGTRHTNIVRENIDGKIVPAYFNIDSIVNQYQLLNSLYASSQALKNQLINEGNKVTFFKELYSEKEVEKQEKHNLKIEKENKKIRTMELEDVVAFLKEIDPSERKEMSKKIRGLTTNNGTTFLNRFLETHEYVPFDELVEKLKKNHNDRKYKTFYNSVILWALDEKHSLKIEIKEEFPIGSKLSNDEIAKKFNKIYTGTLKKREKLSVQSCVTKSNIFFSKKRLRQRDLINSSVYVVKSYNVNGFTGKPLKTIPADEWAERLLRL